MEELDPRLVTLGVILVISLALNIFFFSQPEPLPIQVACTSYAGETSITQQGNFVSRTEESITLDIIGQEVTFQITNNTKFYIYSSSVIDSDADRPEAGQEFNIPEKDQAPIYNETTLPPLDNPVTPVQQYTELFEFSKFSIEPNELLKITYEESDGVNTVLEIMEME